MPPARGKAEALLCPLGQLLIVLGYRQHDTTRVSVCCSLGHGARFFRSIPPKLRVIRVRCHATPIPEVQPNIPVADRRVSLRFFRSSSGLAQLGSGSIVAFARGEQEISQLWFGSLPPTTDIVTAVAVLPKASPKTRPKIEPISKGALRFELLDVNRCREMYQTNSAARPRYFNRD